MPEPLAYLNGQILPQSQASLPFHDAGLIYGAVVTDLVRTFKYRPFRLADHVARFRQSCRSAHIPQPVPDEEVTEIAQHLIVRNSDMMKPGLDLALVMFATPGPINYYAGIEAGGESGPTLVMHTFPLPFARYLRFLKEGVRLFVPSVRHLPVECVDPRIKQRSRMHWWLAEQEAFRADPGSMALLLDANGYVTETASANIVVVRKNIILIPPRSSVLGGVSLQVVEELCGELGRAVAEQPLTLYDLLSAEEVFVTCTTYCLAGVSKVNGIPIPWPGPIFMRLVEAWNQRVGFDIHHQILFSQP